jgi:hypothetical protein
MKANQRTPDRNAQISVNSTNKLTTISFKIRKNEEKNDSSFDSIYEAVEDYSFSTIPKPNKSNKSIKYLEEEKGIFANIKKNFKTLPVDDNHQINSTRHNSSKSMWEDFYRKIFEKSNNKDLINQVELRMRTFINRRDDLLFVKYKPKNEKYNNVLQRQLESKKFIPTIINKLNEYDDTRHTNFKLNLKKSSNKLQEGEKMNKDYYKSIKIKKKNNSSIDSKKNFSFLRKIINIGGPDMHINNNNPLLENSNINLMIDNSNPNSIRTNVSSNPTNRMATLEQKNEIKDSNYAVFVNKMVKRMSTCICEASRPKILTTREQELLGSFQFGRYNKSKEDVENIQHNITSYEKELNILKNNSKQTTFNTSKYSNKMRNYIILFNFFS